MIIRGNYSPVNQNIGIDVPSHIFEENRPVVFHEQTHFYLSIWTNMGSVWSILHEILSIKTDNIIVNTNSIHTALQLLQEDMYDAQEGLAHLIQAMVIFEKKRELSAIKDWEDFLPNKPKAAFNHVKYCLDLQDKQQENFLGIVSQISLNTTIHDRVIDDPNFLLDDRLQTYLSDKNNSSKARFNLICRAVERDNSLLDLKAEEICAKLNIPFSASISNERKASLINAIHGFTSIPTNISASDIRSFANASEALTTSYESMIFSNINAPNFAKTDLTTEKVIREIKESRTIFIYNDSKSSQGKDSFGFYLFSKNNIIINSSLFLNEKSFKLVNKWPITRIIDAVSFDFTKCCMMPERKFIETNIVWHKNYQDLVPLLNMVKNNGYTLHACSVGLTDEYLPIFYIFKLKDSDILFVTAGFPFIKTKVVEYGINFEASNFYEIVKQKEHHLNNFLHDIVGIPHLLNIVEMSKGSESYLLKLEKVTKHGMGCNEKCICGSGKRFEKCHGKNNL